MVDVKYLVFSIKRKQRQPETLVQRSSQKYCASTSRKTTLSLRLFPSGKSSLFVTDSQQTFTKVFGKSENLQFLISPSAKTIDRTVCP